MSKEFNLADCLSMSLEDAVEYAKNQCSSMPVKAPLYRNTPGASLAEKQAKLLSQLGRLGWKIASQQPILGDGVITGKMVIGDELHLVRDAA